VSANSSKADKVAAKLTRMAGMQQREAAKAAAAASAAGEPFFDEHDEAAIEQTFGLSAAEFYHVRDEYEQHMVSGLNKAEFRAAIGRLLEALNCTPADGGRPPTPAMAPPKKADLLKAFDVADRDKSGVVDLGEFVALYSKVKKGEVNGLGRWRLFGR
jgi:hypothetical protein